MQQQLFHHHKLSISHSVIHDFLLATKRGFKVAKHAVYKYQCDLSVLEKQLEHTEY